MPFQQMLTQLAQKRQNPTATTSQARPAPKGRQNAPGLQKPKRAQMSVPPGLAPTSMPGQAPTPSAQPGVLQPGVGSLSPMAPPTPSSASGVGSLSPQGAQQPQGLLAMLQLLAQKRQQPQAQPSGGSSGEATVELPNSQF